MRMWKSRRKASLLSEPNRSYIISANVCLFLMETLWKPLPWKISLLVLCCSSFYTGNAQHLPFHPTTNKAMQVWKEDETNATKLTLKANTEFFLRKTLMHFVAVHELRNVFRFRAFSKSISGGRFAEQNLNYISYSNFNIKSLTRDCDTAQVTRDVSDNHNMSHFQRSLFNVMSTSELACLVCLTC